MCCIVALNHREVQAVKQEDSVQQVKEQPKHTSEGKRVARRLKNRKDTLSLHNRSDLPPMLNSVAVRFLP